ncbi:hypothetical protein Tco_0534280 [Tanacetum coccineum]
MAFRNSTNSIQFYNSLNSKRSEALRFCSKQYHSNPRTATKAITTRSGVSYDGPIPFHRRCGKGRSEVTKDTERTRSTEDIQPPPSVHEQQRQRTNQRELLPLPTETNLILPYPSRHNKEKDFVKRMISLLQSLWKFSVNLHFELKFRRLLSINLIAFIHIGKQASSLSQPKTKIELELAEPLINFQTKTGSETSSSTIILSGDPFVSTAHALTCYEGEITPHRNDDHSLTLNESTHKKYLIFRILAYNNPLTDFDPIVFTSISNAYSVVK